MQSTPTVDKTPTKMQLSSTVDITPSKMQLLLTTQLSDDMSCRLVSRSGAKYLDRTPSLGCRVLTTQIE